MTEQIKILFIGADKRIVSTVIRLLNSNSNWLGIPAHDEEEAKLKFIENNFKIVMFGAGISELTESELRTFFSSHDTSIILLQHYGGGSGLLFGEIIQALDHKKG